MFSFKKYGNLNTERVEFLRPTKLQYRLKISSKDSSPVLFKKTDSLYYQSRSNQIIPGQAISQAPKSIIKHSIVHAYY